MLDLASDMQVLAATVFGEARGEPQTGREAVAAVVMNRVAVARAAARKQFGDGTIRGCCLAPEQFSCWNRGDPNRARLFALDFAAPDVTLSGCIAVAERALAGRLPDPTQGATFYKVSTLAWPRDWGAQTAPLAVIGRHSFYRLS
jgi:spore germination cell wall hydrolase CwlJ-like protein